MFDRNPVMAMAGATDFGIDKLYKLCFWVRSEKILHSFNPFMPCVPKKGTLANTVDSIQTVQNTASDQGQHCLH